MSTEKNNGMIQRETSEWECVNMHYDTNNNADNLFDATDGILSLSQTASKSFGIIVGDNLADPSGDVLSPASPSPRSEESPVNIHNASITFGASTLVQTVHIHLETIHSNKINVIHSILFFFALLALIESIILIVVVALHYDKDALNLPFAYSLAMMVMDALIFLLSVAISFIYTIRVARLPAERRVVQQVNCAFLCWAFTFYSNPVSPVINTFYPDYQGNPSQIYKYLLGLSVPFNLTSTFFIILFFFYTWAQSESYGFTGPLYLKQLPSVVYWRNMFLLLPYAIVRIIIGIFSYTFLVPFPFLNFVGSLVRFVQDDTPFSQFYMICVLTAFELIYCFYGVLLTVKTSRILQKEDYLNTRMQQLGFRIYLFRTLTVFISIYISEILFIFLLRSPSLYLTNDIFGIFIFDGDVDHIGAVVLVLVYVSLEAWCNLPANARGIRGWFYDNDTPEIVQDDEILTYRVSEPVPYVLSRDRCFVLQTAITLFNFSWLVYSYRGGRLKHVNGPDLYGESKYALVCDIFERVTETQCVIYQAADRIIVAFKGTTSIKDWKTDMRATYEQAKVAFPDAKVENFDISLADCKIHTGFVTAFLSIKARVYDTIRKLMEEDSRILFFTGHSLGGALAYLAAMGTRLECGLPDSTWNSVKTYVYTYGAPRIGNRSFAQVYNKVLPSTWSVVFNGDVITTMPMSILGFCNLGNKALLAESGQLFIDPSFGELHLSFFARPGLEQHKKQSYALAFSKWCEKSSVPSPIANIWMLSEGSTVSPDLNDESDGPGASSCR